MSAIITYWQAFVTILVCCAGTWSGNVVDAIWGKDSNKIVIDEVAGMCCTLLFVPHQWHYALVGLILFRFFDIVKPLMIRRMERLPGGFGIMFDDVLAGVYANLILQVVFYCKLM